MKRLPIRILAVLILLILALPDVGYPQDFFPVGEDNIWIYVTRSFGYGPPSPPDTTAQVTSSHSIDGETYWSFRFLPPWNLFRIDNKGNIWFRISEDYNGIEAFISFMDQNPELKESTYYKESLFFRDLNPAQKDLLVYEFGGILPDMSYDSLDREVQLAHLELQFESLYLQTMVARLDDPAIDQRAYSFDSNPGETSGTIVFQRGLGIVRSKSSDALSTRQWETTLLWARIDGVEYGEHPGPRFPGYKTSVESETWGKVKYNAKNKE